MSDLILIGVWLSSVAAIITHIIECINQASYILLAIGVLIPPVGLVHGVAVWFGWA